MTLSSTTTRASYTANGAQTAFAYPFRIDDQIHLQVYLDDALQNTGFAVSGAGNDGGGNVTFVIAPENDANVTLIRAVPLTQPTDLPTQGPLDTSAIEKRFDQIVMQVQGLRELIDRSLVLPPSAGALELQLPALVASRFLAANPDADGLLWGAMVEAGLVSSTMEPVVGAATLAAARSALGLGGLGPIGPADAMKHALIGAAGAVVLGGPDACFNSVLNPDMAIDQVNAGTTVSIVNGDDDKLAGPDGWKAQFVGAGAASFSRVAAGIPASAGAGVVPAYALKIDVTTADTSLASSDRHTARLALEGLDVAWLRYGTADAQTATHSLWLKSPKTGLHEFFVRNANATRIYVAQVTIAAASTWQRVSFTVPGCTDGTWNVDTSTGLTVGINLGVGSTFHTTAGAWQAGSYFGTSSGPNLMDSTGNDIYLTGWQIDPGPEMLPYRGVSYSQNLKRCQRYIRVFGGGEWAFTGGAFIAGGGQAYSTTHAEFVVVFDQLMRGTPTVTVNDATRFAVRSANSGNLDTTAVSTFARAGYWYSDWTVASGLTAGNASSLQLDDTAGTGKIVLNAANS